MISSMIELPTSPVRAGGEAAPRSGRRTSRAPFTDHLSGVGIHPDVMQPLIPGVMSRNWYGFSGMSFCRYWRIRDWGKRVRTPSRSAGPTEIPAATAWGLDDPQVGTQGVSSISGEKTRIAPVTAIRIRSGVPKESGVEMPLPEEAAMRETGGARSRPRMEPGSR